MFWRTVQQTLCTILSEPRHLEHNAYKPDPTCWKVPRISEALVDHSKCRNNNMARRASEIAARQGRRLQEPAGQTNDTIPGVGLEVGATDEKSDEERSAEELGTGI